MGIDARALGEQLRRQLFLRVLITRQPHEDGFLAGNELVTAHAVVLLDHPPAFLNVFAIVERLVLIAGGKRVFLAAEKERGERANLLLREMQVRHAQLFGFVVEDFPLVPDVGFGQLVFKEALVVVPGLLGRAFGQTREVLGVLDGLIAAALGDFRKQREIEALDRLAALGRQFRTDAALVLEPGKLMAAKAPKEANPLLALLLELRVVHERGVRVVGGTLFPERDEIAGDILGVGFGEAEARHYRHVLDLEFMAVVRALAVIEIEDERHPFLFVVLGADVFFLVRTIGARAFASIVDPANQIIIIRFFADACEICRKRAALDLIAFADGMAGEAAARFEQFLAMSGVAGFVLGRGIGKAGLPDECGNGPNLFVGQAKVGHLGGGAEVRGLLQPNGNPVLVQLQTHILEVGPDFLHVLQQAFGGAVELHDAEVDFAVLDFQGHGAIVQVVGFLVCSGFVGLRHEVVGLLQMVFLLLFEKLDFLSDGEKVFGLFVVAFVAVAADAPALAEKILAFTDHPADVVVHQNHVRGVANLATGFVISGSEDRPQPMFVSAVSFFDAGGGAAIALVARRTAESLGIMNSQQVAVGMAGKSARVLIRFLAGQRHGSRGEVDRFANAEVAGLTAVDNLGAVFALEVGGVLVHIDLANRGSQRFHAVLQVEQLRRSEAHHVIGEVGIHQFLLFGYGFQ